MTYPPFKLRKRRLKRHRADLISLGFGLFFLILAAWWSVNYYLDWRIQLDVPNFGWILAGGLIIVGVLGVVASLRRDREETDHISSAELPAEDELTDERAAQPSGEERTEENVSVTSDADEASR